MIIVRNFSGSHGQWAEQQGSEAIGMCSNPCIYLNFFTLSKQFRFMRIVFTTHMKVIIIYRRFQNGVSRFKNLIFIDT